MVQTTGLAASAQRKVLLVPSGNDAGMRAPGLSHPFDPPNAPLRRPTRTEQFQTMFAFFDGYLKRRTEPAPKRTIRYYTLGEGSWHTTAT